MEGDGSAFCVRGGQNEHMGEDLEDLAKDLAEDVEILKQNKGCCWKVCKYLSK